MFAENFTKTDRALEVAPALPLAPDDIRSAVFSGRWTFHVIFNDGTEGEIDLEHLVNSPHAGDFALLRNPELYGKAFLQHGLITWPTGSTEYCDLDLAFHGMYEIIKETGSFTPQ